MTGRPRPRTLPVLVNVHLLATAGVNPCAVVGAALGDGGDLADFDFFVPTFLHGDEEVEGGAGFVGEEDVVEAILIDIDEAQAAIAALGINDGGSVRQAEGQFDPAMLAGVILKHGGFCRTADD